ncbi:hypothetical protein QBC34DRAFT_363466 [Podospora aff. communis PSN243]|uniref:Uncharacterized protein n=1 Tax=Podospora aff. communis PSN243 TaxID=3040156 RepID=A0AAV9G5G0_9PEZI|nr:hypothetical protein QBC34DRAFT_363466 [Podospora aff. communis PSN243]
MPPANRFSHLLPWLVIAVCARTQAYTVFQPTCTSPTEPVNFVSAPNSRGTLEILWSSLFTIFACTWTIQHPNVPEQRDGRFPSWTGDIRWGLRHAIESLKLAVATVLAPEIVIFVAWCDYCAARWVCSKLERFAKDDGVPWTMAHGHYATMGGFVIRVKEKREQAPGSNRPYHLTGADLCYLREKGHLPSLPHMAEEEIADKSKSDPLLKTLAIGQILWSIVQISVRAINGQSISLLELSVLAFAACAIVVYLLYWSKPKNVNTATTVLEFDNEIPNAIKSSFTGVLDPIREFLISKQSAQDCCETFKGQPIRTLTYHDESKRSDGMVFFMYVAGPALFGGVHIAGWNFFFPTQVERILWRSASVYTTAIFVLIIIFGISEYLCLKLFLGEPAASEKSFVLPALAWIYILARLIILVETFRTLVYLPLDAFTSSWTADIPHFS